MSNKDSRKAADKLEARIDAALASWPLADRDAAAWENLAARIEARVARTEGTETPGVTALLEAPLPATPPEVQQSASLGIRSLNMEPASRIAAGPGESKMSQPPERERDRRSLKDLAKLASAPSLTPTPPPSKSGSISPLATTRRSDPGDSGVVDLKMMAELDPSAGERAKDTKLASAELFDEDAPDSAPLSARGKGAPSSAKTAAAGPSSAKTPAAAPSSGKAIAAPPSSSSAADARSAAASVAAPAPASAKAAPKAEAEKANVLVWVAGVGGLLAAAAAAVIMLQSSPSASPSAMTPPAPAVTAAAAPHPSPKPAEPVAAADTPPPDTDPGIDPASLPPSTSKEKGNAHAAAGKAVAAGPQKSVTLAGKPDPAPGSANKPDLVAKNIPMNPLGKDSLNDALRQAAGPTDNPVSGGVATPSTGPQFEPGSVPQKPSAGAIAGGVSAAMSQARSCLGLDDPISRAAVSFDSTGAVTSVVVSGFAAGKPAEACIKAALGKAKVPPFAQPSYTQVFTVRPNS